MSRRKHLVIGRPASCSDISVKKNKNITSFFFFFYTFLYFNWLKHDAISGDFLPKKR